LNLQACPKRNQRKKIQYVTYRLFEVFWWRMWLLFVLVWSLPEAKVKRFMLIALIREVSKSLAETLFAG
jgi:hypothetical protein